MSNIRTSISLIMAAAICATASRAQGGTLSAFEAPTYTAGTSVIGVDLWATAAGSPTADVTPPGSVLEGAQSLSLSGAGRVGVKRVWGSSSNYVDAGMSISWLWSHESAFGYSEFYLSHTVGLGGGGTPAGVLMTSGGKFSVISNVTEVVTGTSYTLGDVYKVTMQFDLFANTPDIYTVLVTNLTAGGAEINLGTYPVGAGGDLDVGSLKANGGIFLIDDGAGLTIVDNIQVIPEPTTVALLVAGGLLAMLRRRRE